LSLGSLKELSDAAAESLSKHQDELRLVGIKSLSNAAAESLSNYQGKIILTGLREMSDEACDSFKKSDTLITLSRNNTYQRGRRVPD
jgi:hypothetical protein